MTSVPFRYLNIRFLSTLRDLPSLYHDMLGVGLVLALQSRIAFPSSLIDTFLGFEAIFGCSKYKTIYNLSGFNYKLHLPPFNMTKCQGTTQELPYLFNYPKLISAQLDISAHPLRVKEQQRISYISLILQPFASWYHSLSHFYHQSFI